MSNLMKPGHAITQQNTALPGRQQLLERRSHVLPKVSFQGRRLPRVTGDNADRVENFRPLGTKVPFSHQAPTPPRSASQRFDKKLYQQSLPLRMTSLSSNNPNQPRTLTNRAGEVLIHLSARTGSDATGAYYQGHNAAGEARSFKEFSLKGDDTLPQRGIMSIKQEIATLATAGVTVRKTYLAGAQVFLEADPREGRWPTHSAD